jgi:Putative adhesin
VQLGTGNVTVQTWDRPDVQVSADGSVQVQHLDPGAVDRYIQRQIPSGSHTVDTAYGPVSLPAEPFVLPQLQGAQHDAVTARGNGNTTITVPRGTSLVMAHVDKGRVTLNDYRGVFWAQAHNGGIFLNRVSGSGYVESLKGRIVATDSTFDRLRARSATSNMIFNNCTSHQIEATSRYGSIVYNNGSFEPGLARFDSEHGNVALGVRGAAQIGAHSESGRVMSNFSNGTQVSGTDNTTQAQVEGGGPVVTATSRDGSVYLYNGSLNEHPQFQAELRGNRASGFARAPVMRAPAATHFAPQYATPRQYGPAPHQYVPQQPRQFVPPPQQGQNPPQPRQYAPPPSRQEQHQERREEHHNSRPPNQPPK